MYPLVRTLFFAGIGAFLLIWLVEENVHVAYLLGLLEKVTDLLLVFFPPIIALALAHSVPTLSKAVAWWKNATCVLLGALAIVYVIVGVLTLRSSGGGMGGAFYLLFILIALYALVCIASIGIIISEARSSRDKNTNSTV
jgi:hypothetical protein